MANLTALERAEWVHVASVLAQAQQKLESGGERHSWLDGAIDMARARAKAPTPHASKKESQRFYSQGKDVLDRESPCVVFAECGFAQHATLVAKLLNEQGRAPDETGARVGRRVTMASDRKPGPLRTKANMWADWPEGVSDVPTSEPTGGQPGATASDSPSTSEPNATS